MSLPNLERILKDNDISHTGLAVCIGLSVYQIEDLLRYSRRNPNFQFIACTEQLLTEARIPFNPDTLWIDDNKRNHRTEQFRPLISLRSVKGKTFPGRGALWRRGLQTSAFRFGKQIRSLSPAIRIKQRKERKTMLEQTAIEHFRLNSDPFVNEIHSRDDIFISRDYAATLNAMERAALYSGFIAVIGEVGSGKTLLRHMLVERIPSSKLRVITPMNADKAHLSPGHILSAIHLDLSGDPVGGDLERRTRKVHKLLLETARQDQRCVLIIEEAHDIPKSTLRILKRLYDYELGFRRPLGIILLGQTELAPRFDDAGIREISRRCAIRLMRGIRGETEKYLAFKLSRVGAKYNRVFADGAGKTIENHCMGQDGKFVSPLSVNLLACLSMNKAAGSDESRVTPAVVDDAVAPTFALK